MPQLLLPFAFACIALSIGLWYRQRWVWYAGWGLFLLFAFAIAALTVHIFSVSETLANLVSGCAGVAGIALFWTTIAVWWKRCRTEFGKPRTPARTTVSAAQKKPDA